MSFFDSKEEVINIELTNYGKELFSKGKFRPKYYAFSDEDIIYDMNYANFTENQQDIQARILEKSIYSKPLTKITGSHTDINKIGSSNSTNQYIPAFKIDFLNNCNISNSYYDNKHPGVLQIDLEELNVIIKGDYLNYDITFDDIVIELEEKNTISGKENFEIKFFEVENENLSEIYFGEKKNNVKNGILMEEKINLDVPESSPENAEYYFKFVRDKKINQNKLNSSKNIYK